MEILYKTSKLKKLLDDGKKLDREYSKKVADSIKLRLTQLRGFSDLSEVSTFPPILLHKLTQNRSDQYAVWAKEKYRIIFYALDDNENIIRDPDYPKKQIKKIKIIEVVNYHV